MLSITVLCILFDLSLFHLYETAIHTNEFAVRIPGPSYQADIVADKYGFVNKGQIGSLDGYYIFEHHHIKKRSTDSSAFHTSLLQNDSMVEWCEQQVIKSRVKRSKVKDSPEFVDPLYPEQWFLHGGQASGYDMNVGPAWKKGYTGKGVVVSILDDGIQGNHPDLALNYDKEASLDINDSDDDPSPQDNDDNKHGTRCAGEVAAVANNEFCGVGVAYNSKIGGVRMLDGSVTDCIEATALSLKPNHIDIYSASWGPEDDGETVDGPGVLAKVAFEDGIKHGRKGLGSIFVWASGNGGKHNDNCNCDGYTNSIYTISISSATQSGLKPWYLEECSSTLATTYSSGESSKDKNIVTVDVNYGYFDEIKRGKKLNYSTLCTEGHTGTSASAPIAAGLCALALEANPNLSWRDMQYIILLTSRYIPLRKESGWITNGVGRKVSTKFGYGLMDGDAVVTVAKSWKTLGIQHICSTDPDVTERIIPSGHGERLETSMHTDGCQNTNNVVKYLEHVQVRITLTFHPRGNLHIILISPSGTPSPILLPRVHDRKEGSFPDWPFMSVHFWGENVEGLWRLVIINEGGLMTSTQGRLRKWALTFYGTEELPPYLNSSNAENELKSRKEIEHPHPVRGLTDSFEITLAQCKADNQFLVALENEPKYCSYDCPSGMYGSRRYSVCHRCDKSCSICYGPSYNNCLACVSKHFLMNSVCVKSCPEGYIADIRSLSGICLPCSSSCLACEGTTNKCILCKSGLYLYKSQCLPYCPPGTFSFENKCLECSNECMNCFGPLNSDCLTCSNGFYLTNTTCLNECPMGYFSNNEEKCVKCHRSCESCHSSACTSCNKNYQVREENGICEFVGCESESEFKCVMNCGLHCSMCVYEECEICKQEFFWTDGLCLKDCPISSYEFFDECKQCYGKCFSCEKDPYDCTSCQDGFYLIQNHCVAVCPNGYYNDNKGMCKKCHLSCHACFGSSTSDCISCHPEKFLLHNSCVDMCPTGFYGALNDDSKDCQICHPSCNECSMYGSFSCSSCFPETNLIHNACIPCLDGEFFNHAEKVCEKCHDNCGACFGPLENQCLTCVPPLRLHEDKHQCLPCCQHENSDCCVCTKDLDICVVNQPSNNFNMTMKIPDEDDLILKKVVPIAVGVSSVAIGVFILLFLLLQYGSSSLCHFNFRRKTYYAYDFSADYNAEREKLSLTQEDLEDDDDEISHKI